MNRTFAIVLGLAAVLALLVVALVGTAWAQTRAPQTQPPSAGLAVEYSAENLPQACLTDGDSHIEAWQSLAQSLGISADEITELLIQGKSLEDIAAQKKLSTAQLNAAIEAAVRKMLTQHVNKGEMNQSEVDKALEMMSKMTPSQFIEMLIGSAHGGVDMNEMMGGDDGGCHGSDGGSEASFSL